MNYWLTGTGLEHVSAELVAADQRGSDERRAQAPPRQRGGQARRALAGALVALAARLAPGRPADAPLGQARHERSATT
jgi:hypothetical protein